MPNSASGDRASARSFRILWPTGIWRFVAAGVLVAFVVRLLLLQVYTVASESMAPTLRTGERVLVWKPAAFGEPKRGDVVVFDGTDSFVRGAEQSASLWAELLLAEPLDRRLFVKRVIAVGGDRIACCDASGRLLLNGAPLTEEYLMQAASRVEFDVQVPPGRFFALGDNRARSHDSRDLLGQPGGGMISTDRIIGKAIGVVWPPARIRSAN